MKATTIITTKDKQANHIPKFLTKTYDLLESKSYSYAIEWHNKGTSILIKDANEFEKILPRFFKHKKMASFVRQLNLYGFKKVKNSQNQFIYYNAKFQSGKKNLLRMMKRKSDNSNGSVDNDFEDNEEFDLVDENRELKKLHHEAAHRINALEIKLKEIAEQNLLLSEIAMKKENEIVQLKNKVAFRCCDVASVSTKSAQSYESCMTSNQKSFQPNGAFKPFAKSSSPKDSLSSTSDQESCSRVNIVKNIIINQNRDCDESESDRKSEMSLVRKPSSESDREMPSANTHNYLTLFSQTIANSSNNLMPIFQFKMDSASEARALMN